MNYNGIIEQIGADDQIRIVPEHKIGTKFRIYWDRFNGETQSFDDSIYVKCDDLALGLIELSKLIKR